MYKAISKLQSKMLKKFGVEVTFTQYTETAEYDPLVGEPSEADLIYTGHGVKGKYSLSEIDGTVIKSGDVKLTLELTDTKPLIGDKATVNGTGDFRVMNVIEVAPAEDVIGYELQLRA